MTAEIWLYRGEGLFSKLIQWQTRSQYSHAAMYFDGMIIDSREGKGVRYRYPDETDKRVDVYQVKLTQRQVAAVYAFAYAQIGKKYDYTMVARFISRRQETRRSSKKWFCSELVFASFQAAGVNLLERIEPWAVSPGLLALSPYLESA